VLEAISLWLRSASFSSLSLGILFLSLPFIARAQSNEALALNAQNIQVGRTEISDFSPKTNTNSNFPEQLRPATPVFSLLSTDSATEPWRNAGEHEDVEEPAQSEAEADIDLLPLFAKWHRDVAVHQAEKQPANLQDGQIPQGYHWKGLLWQSLGFIGVENAYRLSTDGYMRHLLAEQPFWRDYSISLQHWDMDRWSDGDDFLVDDIGHPMQGAVSEFIEIQNSPSARNLRIGTSSAYWKSRFMGLLWATAYSTQQKVGPLGEAGLGSAGGYTYALHCPAPCKTPNVEYTNNTGWTDFIMTPAGGTLWVIGEDAIDRFISDRVQGDRGDPLFAKIVRGALNPTRTMANALRGENPWYRDYLHPDIPGSGGVHFERSDADAIRHLPRYEIFPHFNAFALVVNTATCAQCRKWTDGSGVGFSARLTRWVDFDSDVNYQPNASPLPSDKAGGDALSGTFGLRSGIATPHYALKASIRPGFVSYDHAYLTIPSKTDPVPEIGRITHFATALTINGDYGITRNLAIRGTFGNTPIRYLDGYLQPPGIGKPPAINWLSHEVFLTNENWVYQMGPVLRF
jgi:hypothetical protein